MIETSFIKLLTDRYLINLQIHFLEYSNIIPKIEKSNSNCIVKKKRSIFLNVIFFQSLQRARSLKQYFQRIFNISLKNVVLISGTIDLDFIFFEEEGSIRLEL